MKQISRITDVLTHPQAVLVLEAISVQIDKWDKVAAESQNDDLVAEVSNDTLLLSALRDSIVGDLGERESHSLGYGGKSLFFLLKAIDTLIQERRSESVPAQLSSLLEVRRVLWELCDLRHLAPPA
jgi:hypothetical protein